MHYHLSLAKSIAHIHYGVCCLYRLAAGDETVDSMDTVARHVGHSYDLRSLHRGTGGGDIDSTVGQCVTKTLYRYSRPCLPLGHF